MTDPERYLEAELERTRQERDDARCLLDEAIKLMRPFAKAAKTARPMAHWGDSDSQPPGGVMNFEDGENAFDMFDRVRVFLDLVEKKR